MGLACLSLGIGLDNLEGCGPMTERETMEFTIDFTALQQKLAAKGAECKESTPRAPRSRSGPAKQTRRGKARLGGRAKAAVALTHV